MARGSWIRSEQTACCEGRQLGPRSDQIPAPAAGKRECSTRGPPGNGGKTRELRLLRGAASYDRNFESASVTGMKRVCSFNYNIYTLAVTER